MYINPPRHWPRDSFWDIPNCPYCNRCPCCGRSSGDHYFQTTCSNTTNLERTTNGQSNAQDFQKNENSFQGYQSWKAKNGCKNSEEGCKEK